MKREIAPPSKSRLIGYRIIVALLIALVVILVSGSLYALIRPAGSEPLFRIGGSAGREQGSAGLHKVASGPVGVFSGIGRLRIPAAGEPPATIIVSISFPYPIDDRPFTEELASRIGEFRSIATGYFASLPREKMIRLDEDLAKSEILRRYNALLRLGRIEALYFNDLMIID